MGREKIKVNSKSKSKRKKRKGERSTYSGVMSCNQISHPTLQGLMLLQPIIQRKGHFFRDTKMFRVFWNIRILGVNENILKRRLTVILYWGSKICPEMIWWA